MSDTRRYLRTSTANAGAFPTGPLSAAITPADVATADRYDLVETANPTPGNQISLLNTLLSTAQQRLFFGKWISEPLGGVNIDAQTWTLALGGNENLAAANAFWAVSIYVLKSNGTVRGYVYDADANPASEIQATTKGQVFTVAGVARNNIAATDRLVLEIWARAAPDDATGYTVRFRFDGSTDAVDNVANTDVASYIEWTQPGLFTGGGGSGGETKMYLRDTAVEAAGYAGTELSGAMTAGAGSNVLARDLSIDIGVGGILAAADTAASTTLQRLFLGKWISPPLAVSTISAGNVTLAIGGSENSLNANMQLAASVYVLKADGTVRGFIYDADAALAPEWNTGGQGRVVVVAGASVGSIASDDRLAVELWARGAQADAVSHKARVYYDGPTEPVDGVALVGNAFASYAIFPQAGLFGATVDTLTPTGALTLAGALTITAPDAIAAAGGLTPTGSLAIDLISNDLVTQGQLGLRGDLLMTKLNRPDECHGWQGIQPWLVLGGREVMNGLRTWEYGRRKLAGVIDWGCPPDSVLQRVTVPGPTKFTSPDVDPAPWYDPSRPESAEFLGLFGRIDIGPVISRSVTARGREGAAIGPLRTGPREITATAWLVGSSGRGADYGERWLADQLTPCEDCGTETLDLYLSAPSSDGSDDQAGRYRLYDVGVTSFDVVDRNVCPELTQVSLTLTAGTGYLFSDPALVMPLTLLPAVADPDVDCVPFDQWLCSQPPDGLCQDVNPPPGGTVGAIITIDCTDTGIGGLTIDVKLDCSDTDIIGSLSVGLLERGSVLVIDGARKIITYLTPDGQITDGTNRLNIPPLQIIPWPLLGRCDGGRCICVNRAAYCSGGDQVRVAIQTQERRR